MDSDWNLSYWEVKIQIKFFKGNRPIIKTRVVLANQLFPSSSNFLVEIYNWLFSNLQSKPNQKWWVPLIKMLIMKWVAIIYDDISPNFFTYSKQLMFTHHFWFYLLHFALRNSSRSDFPEDRNPYLGIFI